MDDQEKRRGRKKKDFFEKNNISDQINSVLFRREKIMNSLYHDQHFVTQPKIIPFQDKQHAFNMLLPYHIFSTPSTDDILFEESVKNENLYENIEQTIENVQNILNDHEQTKKQNIVIDLLITEEQKYLANKLSELLRNNKKKSTKPPVKKARRKIDKCLVKLKVKNAKVPETRVVLRMNGQF